MIRALARHLGTMVLVAKHPSVIKIIVAMVCSTLVLALYKRTDNKLERVALVGGSLFFLLWALETMAGYGYGWATIPYNLAVSVVACAVVTVLIGIRVIQMNLDRNPRPK
jgi:hypothetical protein